MKRKISLVVLLVLFVGTTFYAVIMPIKAASGSNYVPFIVATPDTPKDIDPVDAYDSVSINVLYQCLEGLYTYNLSSKEMEPIPRLAAAMGTWSPDHLNLTIPLRQDVTFQDGTKFNATAVKWNFDRIFRMADRSGTGWLYYNDDHQPIVNRTEIIDEYTIRFVLNKPWVTWEKMLAFSGSFIIKPDDTYWNSSIPTSAPLIGTGPFKLTKFVPDQELDFEAYQNYYRGVANISKMVFQVISDDQAASQAMLNHEVHYGDVIPDLLFKAEQDQNLTVLRFKATKVSYVRFNAKHMPLDARLAMTYAFNYSYYIKEISQGEDYELHTPIPDGMQYHNQSMPEMPYFNITKARQILLATTDPGLQANITAAGLNASSTDIDWVSAAENNPIAVYDFKRYTSTTVEKVMQLCQDNFKHIGIKIVDNHIGDWDDWLPYITNSSYYDQLRLSFGSRGPDYNDPINMIEPLYKNDSQYNNFQLNDSTLDQMMTETYNLTGYERRQKFWDIQKYLVTQAVPSMYFIQGSMVVVYNNKYISNADDNLNVFGYWYFYNFKYNTFSHPADNPSEPDEPNEPNEPNETTGLSKNIIIMILIAVAIIGATLIILKVKR
ncbi:MAG: ABC transporter substrate-binding protein [Promethearchaeota archaeon]